MNVKIRKAVVTDASAITTIGVKTWQTAYKGIIPQAYLNSEFSINQ